MCTCTILKLSLPLFHRFLKWFLKAMRGVEQHLVRKSRPSHFTFVGEEMQSGEFYAKMVSSV